MGIGESGFYPAPKARFPWTGLLASWLCALVACALVAFVGGTWLLCRWSDGLSSPDAGLAGGLLFFSLIALCAGTVIVSTVASVIVWLVRRGRK